MHSWRIRSRVLDLSERALVMGIVNVTPDSFSDGGQFHDPRQAIDHGLALVDQGADLLDIGGESTRPGATPVPLEEERRRILPVIEGLAGRTRVPLSVDTSKASLAEEAVTAGAHIINDVTAGTADLDMPEAAARSGAGVVLMHMQGTPQTMQIDPHYTNVLAEIADFLKGRIARFVAAGMSADRIAIDPGIGFGKTLEHNLEILVRMPELLALSRPICLGVSRKGLLGQMSGRPRHERAVASVAVACYCLAHGAAHIVRVHDVAETRDAVRVLGAIQRAQARIVCGPS